MNELNNSGETPLHVACRLGRVEAGKALLEGGAKCDVIGGTGYPIHTAMKYSEKEWVADNIGSYRCKKKGGGCIFLGVTKETT